VTKMSDLLPNDLPPDSPLIRRAAIVSCWLCGIRLHQNQMVPDGGIGCHDVRWYCQDSRSCTERWTADQHRRLAAEATSPGSAATAPAAQTATPPR
jgi:hypothetical protein